jgi:membrane protease YdiL (CAAX protease family)
MRIPLPLLLTAMVLPTLVTWVYFDLLATSAPGLQQLAYGLGKGAQLALPIVPIAIWRIYAWHRFRTGPYRMRPSAMWRWTGTIPGGIALGLLISVAMLTLYFLWLVPWGAMEGVRDQANTKLRSLGLGGPGMLLAVALFYALIHSGFEEFYWRGFVFSGLAEHWGVVGGIVASSIAFMAHHVLVLARFFGWDSPWTYLFSLGVATGGACWAISVSQSGKLTPAWVSHGLVDATLFGIAFHLVYC